jgi:hypothetical protein
MHLPTKCTNCSGKHFAISVRCPKKWEDMKKKRPGLPQKPQTLKTPEPHIILETPRITQQSSLPHEPTAMDIDGLTIPTMSSIVFTSNQAAQSIPEPENDSDPA